MPVNPAHREAAQNVPVPFHDDTSGQPSVQLETGHSGDGFVLGDPAEIDVFSPPESELEPEEGGDGGKGRDRVHVIASDDGHPSSDEDDEGEEPDEFGREATEASGPSGSGRSHQAELEDDHYEIMGAVNAELALEELETDAERDDGNEDRPGT